MPVAELLPPLEAARAVVTPLIGGRAHVLAVVEIANARVHMPVAELVPSLEATRAIVTPLIGVRAHVVARVGIANTRVHVPVAEFVPSLEAARAIVTPLIGGRFAQGESIAAQLLPVTVELLPRDADIGPLV